MTTPRSHKEETEEAAPGTEAAAAAAAEPSSVAIGLSNLAGVPANLSSYLWGSKNEEAEAAAVEEEEAVAAVEEEEGTGVRYVGRERRARREGGRGKGSGVGRIVAREMKGLVLISLSILSLPPPPLLFLCLYAARGSPPTRRGAPIIAYPPPAPPVTLTASILRAAVRSRRPSSQEGSREHGLLCSC